MDIQHISLEIINIDEDQPRQNFDIDALETLKESIKLKGIEVPLIVRKNEGRYMILDGERRFRAASALGLERIPCIIDDGSVYKNILVGPINIFSKQLRMDFLKEKLTGEELDLAIYNLWERLGKLPAETINDLTTVKYKGSKIDWRIAYIVKETGISYTRVKLALDKSDFKNRNKNFDKKIKSKIKKLDDPNAETRYNRLVEETARHAGLRENDDLRKTIIESFLQKDNNLKGQELRERLKRISGHTSNEDDEDFNYNNTFKELLDQLKLYCDELIEIYKGTKDINNKYISQLKTILKRTLKYFE